MTNWQDFHPTVPSISGVITFVPTIDLGALAMALQLVELLMDDAGHADWPYPLVDYGQLAVADWLRHCVAEELEMHA